MAVLTIDCQATGSSPRSGYLLEIGWLNYKASLPPDECSLEEHARSFLVRLPENKKMPRQGEKSPGFKTRICAWAAGVFFRDNVLYAVGITCKDWIFRTAIQPQDLNGFFLLFR
jgi:hypothetical protein